MMTWEIALGIFALVAFVLSVSVPVATVNGKLNKSITKLTCSVDALNDQIKKSDKRLDAHSERLDDHEKRIIGLEYDEKRRDDK